VSATSQGWAWRSLLALALLGGRRSRPIARVRWSILLAHNAPGCIGHSCRSKQTLSASPEQVCDATLLAHGAAVRRPAASTLASLAAARPTAIAATSTGSAEPHDRVGKVNSHPRCCLLLGDTQPSGFRSNVGENRSASTTASPATAAERPRHASLAAIATGTRTCSPASATAPTATGSRILRPLLSAHVPHNHPGARYSTDGQEYHRNRVVA
jgi:hypothetical protein